MDRFRRSGGTWARPSATVVPPIAMRPEVTRSMPARQRSSVVLPEPDGPSRTRKVPAATSRLTSLSAGARGIDLGHRFGGDALSHGVPS
jgi:hypothetical protein